MSVDDLQEVAALARDAPGDFQLTCTRCGEIRDVPFDVYDPWGHRVARSLAVQCGVRACVDMILGNNKNITYRWFMLH